MHLNLFLDHTTANLACNTKYISFSIPRVRFAGTEELQTALSARPAARQAFDDLTPGRQREYADHVASAKRATTRESRVAKILPMIAAGVGLNDKYR